MTQISWFRGMAGEVVADFLRPRTFLEALPPALVLLFLLRLGAPFSTAGLGVALLLFFLLFTTATARHAVATSQGELRPTNDLEEILTFGIRSLALHVWLILPLFALARLLGSRAGLKLQGALLWPVPLPLLNFFDLLQILLLIVLALAPPLCFLLATRYASLGKLFSLEGWQWLLVERRSDLGPLFASLSGGLLLFFLLYLIPVGAVAAILAKVSVTGGVAVSSLAYLVPLSASPKLFGRLCGSFVASERIADVSREEGSLFTPTIVGKILPPELVTASTLAETKVAREPKPDLNEILKGLVGLDERELNQAIAGAEAARAAEDRPLRHVIQLALLARKTGEADKAVQYASEAIDLAAQKGFGDLGFSLFTGFKKERALLTLTPYTWELLGNILLSKEDAIDAAWCYCAGATTAGDHLKAQKRLLQMAHAAEKGARREEALELYDLFLSRYPQTPLAEFAQKGRANLTAPAA